MAIYLLLGQQKSLINVEKKFSHFSMAKETVKMDEYKEKLSPSRSLMKPMKLYKLNCTVTINDFNHQTKPYKLFRNVEMSTSIRVKDLIFVFTFLLVLSSE